jgi:hypothetical protein
MNNNKEFLTKLAQLLEEYDMSIFWSCGECSDLHGVYDECMKIYSNKELKSIATVDGGGIEAKDIRDSLEDSND